MVDDGSVGHFTLPANFLANSGPLDRSAVSGDKADPELKITRWKSNPVRNINRNNKQKGKQHIRIYPFFASFLKYIFSAWENNKNGNFPLFFCPQTFTVKSDHIPYTSKWVREGKLVLHIYRQFCFDSSALFTRYKSIHYLQQQKNRPIKIQNLSIRKACHFLIESKQFSSSSLRN